MGSECASSDICFWISNTNLLNFVDDNTINASKNTIEKIISNLRHLSHVAIE